MPAEDVNLDRALAKCRGCNCAAWDSFLVFWYLEQVMEAGLGLEDRPVGGELPR